jgi:hypothetical protein
MTIFPRRSSYLLSSRADRCATKAAKPRWVKVRSEMKAMCMAARW